MFSQASVILSIGQACVAGGHAWQGDMCGMRGHVWHGGCAGWRAMCGRGGHAWQGACMAGETATAVDGTHPTEMHSCLLVYLLFFLQARSREELGHHCRASHDRAFFSCLDRQEGNVHTLSHTV